MKRKLENTEIADYVFKKLNEMEEFKNIDFDYYKILEDIDISIDYSEDFETDENGEIIEEFTEKEIEELKEQFFEGIKAEYEYY